MNTEIFERVAETFTEYCADHFDSGYEDAPEGFDNSQGFLNYFKKWLQQRTTAADSNNQEKEDTKHILNHFNEVEVEEIDDDVYIPVIRDSNSTVCYME